MPAKTFIDTNVVIYALGSNSAKDARAFFERLKPLESFADTEPETYVRKLRNTSRLLLAKSDDA